MKNIECSIIIPIYNAEKYLKDTIESVLNQTFKNFELICINDCSTDGSLNILHEYQKKDSRIIILNNETNLKVAETRNCGVQIAKADWIALLDADDKWDSTFLEKMIKRRDELKSQFLCSNVNFITNEGNLIAKKINYPRVVSYKMLLKQNKITCSTVLIKKQWLLKYPFSNEEIHEDYLCWLCVVKDLGKVDIVDEPLAYYRLTVGSKSRNKFKAILMSYKTYRRHELNIFKSLYYTFCNAINGLKKYRGLK